jgi:DNA-binding MarR family transcriptional regulator
MTSLNTADARHHAAIRSLLAIADRIRGGLERELTPHEITFQQYNVLRILADAGAEGLPTLEVAERLMERTPGITRLMDRLEGRGLVTRKRGADRRQVLCSISDAGAKVVTELHPTVAAVEQSAVIGLNPNELGAFNHFLNRIRAGIRDR